MEKDKIQTAQFTSKHFLIDKIIFCPLLEKLETEKQDLFASLATITNML